MLICSNFPLIFSKSQTSCECDVFQKVVFKRSFLQSLQAHYKAKNYILLLKLIHNRLVDHSGSPGCGSGNVPPNMEESCEYGISSPGKNHGLCYPLAMQSTRCHPCRGYVEAHSAKSVRKLRELLLILVCCY